MYCDGYEHQGTGGSFNVTVVQVTTTADGLVGHWKFDEGSGTTALDSSGHGHDGAILDARHTGTDGADTPTSISALRFDGSGIVVIPDAAGRASTIETPQASLTFAGVTTAGTATIQQIDASQTNVQLPGQYSIGGAIAYEIPLPRPCWHRFNSV